MMRENCKIDSLETIECWSDISSMEIFVNQGSKVFSMRMFTEERKWKSKNKRTHERNSRGNV